MKPIERLYLGILSALILICGTTAWSNEENWQADVEISSPAFISQVDDEPLGETLNLYNKSVPNFHKVTDELYRGGRPANSDLSLLQRNHGIQTIINLENKPQFVRQEQQTAERLGMRFFSSPMSWKVRPTDQQINQILAVLQDSKNFPIFIHCHHGRDRTGLVLGLYRVEIQGWTPDQAYKEMLQLGFHPQFKALDGYFRTRTGYHVSQEALAGSY